MVSVVYVQYVIIDYRLFCQCCLHRPLVHLGLKLFHQFNVISTLDINETIAYNWLTMVETKYWSSNTYHNSTHAADVLQATAYFLKRKVLQVNA